MFQKFGIAITDKTVEEKIGDFWQIADNLARKAADENSRMRYMAWLVDENSSATRKERILEVQAWMDSVWTKYAEIKHALVNNLEGTFSYSEVGECPWNFWDIANS